MAGLAAGGVRGVSAQCAVRASKAAGLRTDAM